MSLGKFTTETAQKVARRLYQQYLVSTTKQCCCTIVQLDSTRSQGVAADGSVIKTQPQGLPGDFALSCKLHNDLGLAKRQEPVIYSSDQQIGRSLVLAKDATYFYVRESGSTDKYYLPISETLIGEDYHVMQGQFSSDGKAILISTMVPNSSSIPNFAPAGDNPAVVTSRNITVNTSRNANAAVVVVDRSTISQYHQIGRYSVFQKFQLIDYTTEAIADLNMDGLSYPVAKDIGKKILYCAKSDTVNNAIDVNSFTDTFVDAPAALSYGGRTLFFPYSRASSASGFFQFNGINSRRWDQDSGMQYFRTQSGAGFTQDDSNQKSTKGLEQITWKASQNSSIFTNYTFTFNNDKDGNYDADLVVSWVNCYFFGMTNFTWTTNFDNHLHGDVHVSGGDNYAIDFINHYDEVRTQSYTYGYPSDFAYTLQYFAHPDVWLPINVTSNQITNTWIKHISAKEDSSNPSSPIHLSGEATYDAISNTYVSTSGSFYFSACQFAYSTFYTLGPPFINEIYTSDFYKVDYYTGLQRITVDVFNQVATNFPGIYIHFAGPTYDYADLNYDNLFDTAAATYYAVFGGRSSGVINNLASTPKIYGIVSQILGDGADFNNIRSAFRGRNFTVNGKVDNSNTAFVYKQDFNQVNRYSSPWLDQGNLANIQGTGQVTLSNPATDPYTTAIVDLVSYLSLADAFDNQPLVTQIQGMIDVYRSQSVPTTAQVNDMIDNIIAMSSDLTAGANVLRNQLLTINAALGTGGDVTLIGQDVIGYDLPDIYTDKIFSPKGQWPFKQSGVTNNFLKALDSYIVQGYYLDTDPDTGTLMEIIQNYNVDPTGLVSLGASSTATKVTIPDETLLDYILPLRASAETG